MVGLDAFKTRFAKNIVKAYMLNTPQRWKYGSITRVGGEVKVTKKSGETMYRISSEDINKHMRKKGWDKEYY